MESNTFANSKKPQDGQIPRKISLPSPKIQNRITVDKLRENFKRQMSLPKEKDVVPMHDPLQKAQDCISKVRGKTGIIYSTAVNEHICLWDPEFPENPERLNCILRRCNELALFSECEVFEPAAATEKYIQTLHTEELYEVLRCTQYLADVDELEELASKYDSVYFHPKTFSSAMIAAGCTLEIVSAVVEEKIQNGMSLVRPPGHHAMKNEFCGYCYLNNTALAAKFALDELHLKRVLIVDWDVHHGQGTQQLFYDDPRVLFFSTHRYEHGKFWPNLRESEFDYIGVADGMGFNFNIPLNDVGLKNGDFLAYFHQILLPVAYEFNPELILVSAGYDAALGCAEGRMNITPAFYSHLTSMLMGLANGKVVAVLEGGYCPESLSEGTVHTLRALMGKPCPALLDPVEAVSQSMRETILNVICTHKQYWNCLQYQESGPSVELSLHTPTINFYEPAPVVEGRYPTKIAHESYLENEMNILRDELMRLKEGTCLAECQQRVCLVYDEIMEKHVNLFEKNFPERPARTQEIMKKLDEFGILKRIHRLKSRKATTSEIELVHSSSLTKMVCSLPKLSSKELRGLQNDYDSIYFHEKTAEAAFLASGCLLQVVDSVCEKESQSGIAVIRPPGHHAEKKEPYGFCIFNNVAIAATYALKKHSLRRILIVDWDIHHGNGIQRTFEPNPNVLYISIHLFKNGNFFPFSSDADSDKVGKNQGRGFNINIPWNKSGMGDAEYIAAFTQIVLPVAYLFNPELVLVSAGFDAAVNDPLGGCCVTPECFGHMTHLLTTLANGNVILALEGGYNVSSISLSMALCAKALLGDPLPSLSCSLVPNGSAVKTIKEVIHFQKEFWPSLCFQVAFPDPSTFSLASYVVRYDNDLIDGISSTPLKSYINKNSPGDSDSEFLTPPQTPEHQSSLNSVNLSTSQPSYSAVDNVLADLSGLSLSDHYINLTSDVPSSVLESASESLSPSYELSSSKKSAVLNFADSANCNLAQGTNDRPLANQSEHSQSQLKSIKSTVNECHKKNSQSSLPNIYSCMQSGQPNNTAGPSKAASDDPGQEELEGAVGGSNLSSELGITMGQLLKGQSEMYAVMPLTDCPHLVEVTPIPSRGINVFSPCEECLDPSENWICLTCYAVLCGRYVSEHMIEHSLCSDHHIVLSYADLSVWCYACESYVDNEILRAAKDAAHRSKFDIDLPL